MVRFLVLIGLACLVGVLSANYVVQGRAGLVNQTSGQWGWWPNAGSTAIDPYTRFHFLAQHRLPMSKFETFEVEAKLDKQGRPLDADCVYQLSGRIPDARWWSLASYVADGDNGGAAPEFSMSAHDVVSENDGSVVITISKQIRAGNWMKPVGSDEFTLLLRLYNPANSLGSAAALSSEMPSIIRQGC